MPVYQARWMFLVQSVKSSIPDFVLIPRRYTIHEWFFGLDFDMSRYPIIFKILNINSPVRHISRASYWGMVFRGEIPAIDEVVHQRKVDIGAFQLEAIESSEEDDLRISSGDCGVEDGNWSLLVWEAIHCMDRSLYLSQHVLYFVLEKRKSGRRFTGDWAFSLWHGDLIDWKWERM